MMLLPSILLLNTKVGKRFDDIMSLCERHLGTETGKLGKS